MGQVRLYDFDDGQTPAAFTINDTAFGIRTDRVRSGGYSLGVNGGGSGDYARFQEPEMAEAGGSAIERLEFHHQEDSAQTGSGIVIYGPSGEEIAGWWTDNPQWVIYHGATQKETVYNGDNYDVWLQVILTFDWDAGTFSYDITDPVSGHNETGTRDMINNPGGASYVDLMGYGGGTLYRGDGDQNWYDDWSITLPSVYEVGGVVTEEGTAVERTVRVFDTAGKELGNASSDPGDGSYTVTFSGYSGDVYVLAEPAAGYRPLAHGPVTPAEVT